MHSWSLISSETTGSSVVKLKDGIIKVYATLSPRPCSSIFKPLAFSSWLHNEEQIESAVSYWLKRKKFVEKISSNKELKKKFIQERNKLENEILNAEWNENLFVSFWDREDNLINGFLH